MTPIDILLHIDSYPKPTTPAAIDEAVALTASLGGLLTALAVEIDIPVRRNRLADYLIGLSMMAEAEEALSRTACRDGLAHFRSAATAAGVFQAAESRRVNHYEVGEYVAQFARTFDLCLLPMVGGFDGQAEVAESVAFASGRPVLIFPAGKASGLIAGPDLATVAWDGSRSAARALADALPILKRARRVEILTILNEKPDDIAHAGDSPQRHLRVHGIASTVATLDAAGLPIGEVFDRYVERHGPDLLVMGAYSHSRAREFFLGGATEHALRAATCPILLSH